MEWDEYKKSVTNKSTGTAVETEKKAVLKAPKRAKVLDFLKTQYKRKAASVVKGLAGDIPFYRKNLTITPQIAQPFLKKDPGKIPEDFKPRSGIEKTLFTVPRLARDFTALGKIGKLGSGAKFIAGAGAFGAATADTEKPIEIGKSAAVSAALFKAADVGFKQVPKGVKWAYEKLPQSVKIKMSKLGQSIGTSLKQYTDITKYQFKRHADIKVKQIESAQFKKAMQEGLPDVADREALVFMLEKTPVPKGLARPDIEKSLAGSAKSEIMRDWSNKLRGRYESAKEAMAETYGKDAEFVKDYVNRLWDIPKSKEKQTVNWFMRKSSHSKKRVINTIKQGVDELGLKPKTLDAAELINYYENNVYTAMANENFIKNISKIKVEGIKAIQRADRAPQEWKTVYNPAVNRAMGVRNKAGNLIIRQSPVKVHPEIHEEIKSILGSKNNADVVRGLEGVNAFAKHSNLSLSLFHHIALGESAIATGVNAPKVFLESIKQMKKGKQPVLNNPAFKDAAASGLEIGAPSDVSRNLVEKSLVGLNERLGKRMITKPLKVATKPLEWVVKGNNKFLWDYLHPNLKLYGYERGVQTMLKNPKFKNVPVEKVKQSVAQIINDTFGGQSWELLTKSPQWRQSMHLALLSPDWTLSTARQFGAMFGAGGRGKIDSAIRQELGSEFWKMGSIILFGGINQLNKAFTQMYLGESRPMWENESGHKTHLFLGKNPDGTNEYLRWGKQFREAPEFFMKPVEKVTGKMSPLSRGILAQTPFTDRRFNKIYEKEGLERAGERVKEGIKTFAPYSVSGQVKKGKLNPLAFAFPISKGLNYYSAKDVLSKALRSKKKKNVLDAMFYISENGHDAMKILDSVKNDLRKTKSTKEWKDAQSLFNKINVSGDKKSVLKKYEEKGKGTKGINKKLISIMKERIEAKKQYKKLRKIK